MIKNIAIIMLSMQLQAFGMSPVFLQSINQQITAKITPQTVWDRIKEGIASAIETFNVPLKYFRSKVEPNPFKYTPSQILSGQMSDEERDFVAHRTTYVKEKIAALMGQEFANIPTIGLCTSGGGYRALISSLGILSGLQDIGVYDTVMYHSSLSGSAWALATWLSSDQSVWDFTQSFKQNLQANPRVIPNQGGLPAITKVPEINSFLGNLAAKFAFNQPISTVDVWGGLIINNVLNHVNEAQKKLLSHQKDRIIHQQLPLPIYTAVQPSTNAYEWFEFTPFDVRNITYNVYTKTEFFGRKYRQAIAVTSPTIDSDIYPPELPLSFYIGIFGSAYTVSLKEMLMQLKEVDKNIENFALKAIDVIINGTETTVNIGARRISVAEVYNPRYGVGSSDEYAHFIDAGIDFNLPTPPLLQPERHVDLMIMLDASANYANQAPALQATAQYCTNRNIQFPAIDYGDIHTKRISLFQEEGKMCVVYIPFINDCLESFCGTFNFAYTAQEFDYVFSTARNAVIEHADLIKQAVRQKCEEKNK